jgi:hypothetical protein
MAFLKMSKFSIIFKNKNEFNAIFEISVILYQLLKLLQLVYFSKNKLVLRPFRY